MNENHGLPVAHHELRRWIWLAFGLVFLALGIFAWGSDFFSLQGQRTLYTARCLHGQWAAGRCTGSLAAAERIRFKADKSHREVDYWTVGASAPSGRMTQCEIANGRSWTCAADSGQPGAITHALIDGQPLSTASEPARSTRCVSKWTWFRLQAIARAPDG